MKFLLSSSCLVVVPALLLGCSRESGSKIATPPAVQAQLVHSAVVQAPQDIRTTGTIHARETAVISAQIPARIGGILVQAGDRVRAGQLLVTLDDGAMRAGLSQAAAAQAAAEKQQMAAQAEASLAGKTLARYEILRDQKSVSPQEFDEVQKRSETAQLQLESYTAQSEQAKAAVAGAHTQLGYTALHAPFAGTITARMADPGTLATPGVPLLQIDRDGPLQVYSSVDESLIGAVRPGMKVPVSVQGMDAGTLSGVVAEIIPAADPVSHSFLVKLDLAPARALRAGMFATADFPGSTRSVIVAPQSAVVMRGSLACVYTVDQNGIAQLRYVTPGNRQGENVEILSGLAAGETLVNNPGDRDLAGQHIESENGAQ